MIEKKNGTVSFHELIDLAILYPDSIVYYKWKGTFNEEWMRETAKEALFALNAFVISSRGEMTAEYIDMYCTIDSEISHDVALREAEGGHIHF